MEPLAVPLAYRPPLDAAGLLAFLAARSVPGVEAVAGGRYVRTFRLDGLPGAAGLGWLELDLSLTPPLVGLRAWPAGAAPALVDRGRRLLDLDADPSTVGAVLGADPVLAPLVARNPGLRVPGAWDGFELAVRAVLGQQVSMAAARTLLGRLVVLAGSALPPPVDPAPPPVDAAPPPPADPSPPPANRVLPPPADRAGPPPGERAREAGSVDASPERLRDASRPGRLFPTAEEVLAADLGRLGVPASRRRTLVAVAGAVAEGRVVLEPGADIAETTRRLVELPGVGPWTAAYVALRALGDSDAFLVGDLALARAAARAGLPSTWPALRARAEAWRPWRGYASLWLWSSS